MRSLALGADAREQRWLVPYLPIDPADIGRDYDAVIRVNSQSGKGGIAYLLEREFGVELPRRLQIEFARTVQAHADSVGDELTATDLWSLFERTYLAAPPRDMPALAHYRVDGSEMLVTLRAGSDTRTHRVTDSGPVEGLVSVLAESGFSVDVLSLHQTSIGGGSTADALTLLEYRDVHGTAWAAGRATSVLDSTFDAVMRAASRNGQMTLIGEGCPRLDSNQRPAL
ncbi:alpha-isopropylmalate synthase regulatory domain-containing protein [Microbacterium sp. Leaf320]|uniref:alpha-isopropylmalate synthase regulatory domain-containing protein n=1 Tax=Microbacterium sp. Leaf320 TaxID=1736334 RepID=UPI0039E05502